jgi:hypothetical protein
LLHTLKNLFEVESIFKCHLDQAKRFKNRFFLEELRKAVGSLAAQTGLFESKIDDTVLDPMVDMLDLFFFLLVLGIQLDCVEKIVHRRGHEVPYSHSDSGVER